MVSVTQPEQARVGVQEGAYLQLDDVVALERVLPGGEIVKVYGVVSQVRARHIGVRFDSDVFLVAAGPALIPVRSWPTFTSINTSSLVGIPAQPAARPASPSGWSHRTLNFVAGYLSTSARTRPTFGPTMG